MNDWWSRASTEQKLVQVRHAVEMGLTEEEASILLGAPLNYERFEGNRGGTVRAFALYHGIRFGAKITDKHRQAASRVARANVARGREAKGQVTYHYAFDDRRGNADAAAMLDGFRLMSDEGTPT